MTLHTGTIVALASRLVQAEQDVTAIDMITQDYSEMTLADAYAIQDVIRATKANCGAVVTGLKWG